MATEVTEPENQLLVFSRPDICADAAVSANHTKCCNIDSILRVLDSSEKYYLLSLTMFNTRNSLTHFVRLANYYYYYVRYTSIILTVCVASLANNARPTNAVFKRTSLANLKYFQKLLS